MYDLLNDSATRKSLETVVDASSYYITEVVCNAVTKDVDRAPLMLSKDKENSGAIVSPLFAVNGSKRLHRPQDGAPLDRGCVEDQPQHFHPLKVLRLAGWQPDLFRIVPV